MTSTFYIKTVKMKEAFNDDDREHLLLEHRSDPLKRRFKRLKRLAETNLCLTVPETSGKCHCLVFVFFQKTLFHQCCRLHQKALKSQTLNAYRRLQRLQCKNGHYYCQGTLGQRCNPGKFPISTRKEHITSDFSFSLYLGLQSLTPRHLMILFCQKLYFQLPSKWSLCHVLNRFRSPSDYSGRFPWKFFSDCIKQRKY